MTQIAGKPFGQLLNLNILDELRIRGVLIDPAVASFQVTEVSTAYTAVPADDGVEIVSALPVGVAHVVLGRVIVRIDMEGRPVFLQGQLVLASAMEGVSQLFVVLSVVRILSNQVFVLLDYFFPVFAFGSHDVLICLSDPVYAGFPLGRPFYRTPKSESRNENCLAILKLVFSSLS